MHTTANVCKALQGSPFFHPSIEHIPETVLMEVQTVMRKKPIQNWINVRTMMNSGGQTDECILFLFLCVP